MPSVEKGLQKDFVGTGTWYSKIVQKKGLSHKIDPRNYE
jgi:hypothetical protein